MTPEQIVAAMPSYPRMISEAMVILAKAIETALNLRDHAVLAGMKAVADEIFEQADRFRRRPAFQHC